MANLPGGYNGKLLRVNLTTGKFTTEELDAKFLRQYLGGAGFVAYYLWKELKKGVDALGPDNKLIFANGPVSGYLLPGAARNCIGAKSPLTGSVAKAECGGFWGAELKRAGFDVIIVEGKAEKPVYLWIQDGEVSIKDAKNVWGKEGKDTEAAIQAELGDDKVRLAWIGQAGENKVLYSCIMEGLNDAAGRGGLGAVMGSKNLKAIAVRGHKLPEIANGEALKEIRVKMVAKPHPVSQFGTGGPDMEVMEKSGNLPVRNFRDGLFPEVKVTNGGYLKETYRVGMEGCFACPVRCKKIAKIDQPDTPYKVDPAYGGPEYETMAAFGSDCGNGDMKAICKANERCNAYGLDTISMGMVIGFAMECFEKGYLTTKDTGGIDLKFGNADAMLKCVELTAKREGFGNFLAEGTLRMSKKIGKDSKDFAIQTKGLETGMHDPRTKVGLGLGYMVNPHGGDHCCGMRDMVVADDVMLTPFHALGRLTPVPVMDIGPKKVGYFHITHCFNIIEDAMVTCTIVPIPYQLKADILTAITGWDTGIGELVTIGERILTVFRLFNIREGFTDADDVLPERFFQPKTDGALVNMHLKPDDFDKAKRYYYALMGWDNKGVPLPAKVEDLEIK